MRPDSVGLMWFDAPVEKRRGAEPSGPRPMPPIPDTGWEAPREFPRLDSYKGRICIDCETYDPNLLTTGPSTRTGGRIVGLAVGTADAQWYFPTSHAVGANMDEEAVQRWARDQLTGVHDKVFANAAYDLEWLEHDWGLVPGGRWLDIQYAEPLLDENAQSYSLNALATKYLGEAKTEEALYDWASRAYGGKADRKQAGNIYRCPPALVGPYAEGDVRLPLLILDKQWPVLQEQGLLDLFLLECRLLPMLLAMRRHGVRVDVAQAERLYEVFGEKAREAIHLVGIEDVWAAGAIAGRLRGLGVEFPLTEGGSPSFTQEWLSRHADARVRAITEARRYLKARDTFIKGYLLDKHVDGRLYGQFHPLRSDDNGTVSGRFSSSGPNLQNLPNRDPEIGPAIRSLFIPEDGMEWGRLDWSQIEFRVLTHFGLGPGAEEAREMYRRDPTTDFHQMCSDLTGVARKPAKNINFGLVYGMGEAKMAASLGRSLEEVKPLFTEYHEKLPFVRRTFNAAMERATKVGMVRTLLGRRRRFELWEPSRYKHGGWGQALPLEAAGAKWPDQRLKRAYTNKALNAVLQGSAADLMKLAMVRAWDAGLFDDTLVPHLTVHDELDVSFSSRASLGRLREIMETCYQMKVPIVAEVETGRAWG